MVYNKIRSTEGTDPIFFRYLVLVVLVVLPVLIGDTTGATSGSTITGATTTGATITGDTTTGDTTTGDTTTASGHHWWRT